MDTSYSTTFAPEMNSIDRKAFPSTSSIPLKRSLGTCIVSVAAIAFIPISSALKKSTLAAVLYYTNIFSPLLSCKQRASLISPPLTKDLFMISTDSPKQDLTPASTLLKKSIISIHQSMQLFTLLYLIDYSQFPSYILP